MRNQVSSPEATWAFIAIGSNEGPSERILRDAVRRLQQFSSAPLRCSSIWDSSPVDCPRKSRRFMNAVIALQPHENETPESLLETCRALEREFGRRPKQIPNEPRTLDLDLIAFGNQIRSTPDLTLPHPRAHLRRFVLQPLSEIAPNLILPGQEKNVAALLAFLETDETLNHIASLA